MIRVWSRLWYGLWYTDSSKVTRLLTTLVPRLLDGKQFVDPSLWRDKGVPLRAVCLAFLVPEGLSVSIRASVLPTAGGGAGLVCRCASWPELEADDSGSGAHQNTPGRWCGAQARSEEGGGYAESRIRKTLQARPQQKLCRTGLGLDI